jgi:transcriptional regulator with XRE-family HTH domain
MSKTPLHERIFQDDPEAQVDYERLRPQHEFVRAMVEARTKLRWTQRDLAAAVGVSQPVIARLESGDHDPKIGTVAAICAALGLSFTIGDRSLVPRVAPTKRRSA